MSELCGRVTKNGVTRTASRLWVRSAPAAAGLPLERLPKVSEAGTVTGTNGHVSGSFFLVTGERCLRLPPAMIIV